MNKTSLKTSFIINKLLTFTFIILCMMLPVLLTSCDKFKEKDPECLTHIDDNHDGKCDKCGAEVEIECTEHIDANTDLICDVCGESLPCPGHVDDNLDGKCDYCSESVPCVKHIDANKDALCDVCGVTVPCITHIDENLDAHCDVCGEEIPCVEHQDFEHDGICNVCGEDISDIELTLTEIYSRLDEVIPATTSDNLTLPNRFDKCSAHIVWTTDNQDVINYRGTVKRAIEDVEVTLTATIAYSNTDKYTHEMKTVVKKLVLKSLSEKKIVLAYLYASSGFSGVNEESLNSIDYINYAFGSVVGGEAYVVNSSALQTILGYHNQGIRVGLALGGWGAGGFSEAVSTAEARTKFADSAIKLMKDYGFDGIDIDWEYPTSSVAGITSSPNDKVNLTLFCQELSAKMKTYRSDAILTMAVAPSNCFDFEGLTPYVDYFNIMTYDFSIGSASAMHDSNLYSSSYSSSSVNSSVNYLKNKGVPSSKIIIGAAFYGRWATFKSSSSMKLGSSLSTTLKNSMKYSDIYKYIQSGAYTESWDDVAKAPYIIKPTSDGSSGMFITYDNPRSVTCKCEYVLDNDLAGIMFWELTQDNTGTLVAAMNTTFTK